MALLIVNAGSSSLRLRLLGAQDQVLMNAHVDGHGDGLEGEVTRFIRNLPEEVEAVGHRVVHGGERFDAPALIDERSLGEIEGLAPLAPLHQPRAVAAISAVASLLPTVPSVACFDTSFHATMPAAATTYALPRQWRERWPLRRFGFHGLSHSYASRRALAMLEEQRRTGRDDRRVVVCHLGAGASVCATVGGISVDTTMGLTPAEGVVMATRSGSVDPGLLLWLMTEAGLSAAEVEDGLRTKSGLAGLAGGGGDMRDVLTRRDAGDRDATLAIDVYVHRLVAAVAAMAASAGGIDALVFTGGVGEKAAPVRAAAVRRLAFLGLAIDDRVNDHASGDADNDVSAPTAAAATLVLPAREDLEIARGVRSVIAGAPS